MSQKQQQLNCHLYGEAGFTVIELIIVMAILGVLLGVATVSGREWLEQSGVENQTKELYVDLMNARVSALQRNRTFFVTLATNQYAIYEDTSPTPDGDGTLQRAQDRLIMNKITRFPIIPHMSFGLSSFHIGNNGLVSHNGTIQLNTSVETFSDCIILFSTRILMGKWNKASSKCIAQ